MGLYKLILLAVLLIASGTAMAQLLTGVTISQSGGGSPTPPTGCNGAIDLSTGCVMPMLR